jgi:ADP-L-glycero-D-manno-heptose 6-epimerase
MDRKSVILLTGAAGFIGSYLLGYLNQHGYEQIIISDEFSRADKVPNYSRKKYLLQVEREELFDWLKSTGTKIDFIFHLGARTDTTEFDYSIHEKLNLEFSKEIWRYSVAHNIPLVYASSAATYGAGEHGYKDDHSIVNQLKPLNPYGISKNEFDKWLLEQSEDCQLPAAGWQGLKFFNVYGPNEYHKGRMASVIFHSSNQIRETGKVKLFRSHRPDFKDGQQLRDFIYVKDVARVCVWLMENRVPSGLYNLGTGKARSFEDLAKATFSGLGLPPVIEYVDMPGDIRDKYQYFTEADMQKLKDAGYTQTFTSLEEGVEDYVKHFLKEHKYF